MKKIYQTMILVFAMSLATMYCNGQEKKTDSTRVINKFYVGLQVGTFGPAIELVKPLTPFLTTRLVGNYFKTTIKSEKSTSEVLTNANTTVLLGGVGLILDWRPTAENNSFHISTGVYYKFTKLTDSRHYTYIKNNLNEDLGQLDLEIYTTPYVPYVALLFGENKAKKRVNTFLELGFLYIGKPKVKFTGIGSVEPTAEQDEIIAGNLSKYNVYPNLNIHINVRLGK